jgi:SprB repeat
MKKSVLGLVVSCFMITSIVSLGQNRSCSNSPQQPQPTACPGYKTYTQGAWGANPCGGNAATFLQTNFAAVFPTGITIGCTNKLKFTTSTAIRNFLPSGGTAAALPSGTLINPSCYSNVLAGQLLAATLNVKFDEYFSSFAPAAGNLKNLVIASGPFVGMTVQQLIDNANSKIGGCAAFNKTFAEYNTALTNVNATYDNGVVSGGFLACPLVAAVSATSNVTCYGGNNGSITMTASNGVAPYSYNFGNGNQSSNTKTGLAAGSYTVTVSDAIGQLQTFSVVISQNSQIQVASVVVQNVCNAQNGPAAGSVQLNVNGGVAPYGIMWNNNVSGATNSGLAAGSYCYQLTDAVGCQSSGCYNITEPAAMSVSISTSEVVRCFNECNGEAFASVTGGNGTYSYLWSNGQTQFIAENLCPGNYSVTATDGNGCSVSSSALGIDNPALLVASASQITQNICNADCNATAQVSVSGGEPNYVIVWSNQQQGELATGLCAGTYSASVTDGRGCMIQTNEVNVVNPSAISFENLSVGATSNCNDANNCDATVSFDAIGGTAPYTYSWNVPSGVENIATNLCADVAVAVDVTDANNCTVHFDLGVTDCIPAPLCGPGKTFTPAQYGSNNGDAYTFLQEYFNEVFPNGITIGCQNHSLHFNTAQSVVNYLPISGTPSTLPQNSSLSSNLLTAVINAAIDAYDEEFAGSDVSLGDMYVDYPGFETMTVSEVIDLANQMIGGCVDGQGGSISCNQEDEDHNDYEDDNYHGNDNGYNNVVYIDPSNNEGENNNDNNDDNEAGNSTITLAELNAVLALINTNYLNGTQDNGNLSCAPIVTPSAGTGGSTDGSNCGDGSNGGENDHRNFVVSTTPIPVISVYPNPIVNEMATLNIDVTTDQVAQLTVYGAAGQLIYSTKVVAVSGSNVYTLDFHGVAKQTCIVNVVMNNQSVNKLVVLQ